MVVTNKLLELMCEIWGGDHEFTYALYMKEQLQV